MTDAGLNVLAFGPHPDDVELFCGGTLLTMASRGYVTGVVDLTRGELASNGTPAIRAREAESAASVLKLSFRENLGLPDGGLDPGNHPQVARIVEVIRRRRPELALVPWTEARHPDHAAAGALIAKAAYWAGVAGFKTEPSHDRFTDFQVAYYAMRHTFTPSFIVDVSSVIEEKRRAIRCHVSQVVRAPEGQPTLVNARDAVEAIVTRDGHYGAMIGVRYGEPFKILGPLAVADPVAHFRNNPLTGAFTFEVAR